MERWELSTELLHYRLTLAAVALEFIAIAGLSRRRQVSSARPCRPPWDSTWFVPIYVWGIESLLHAHSSLTTVAAGHGLLGAVFWLLIRLEVSGLALLCALGACAVAEWWAVSRGLPARAGVGAVPFPTVAAIIAVYWTWLRVVLAFLPVGGE